VDDIVPDFADIQALLSDQSPSKVLTTQLFRYVERQWLNKTNIGPSRLSFRDNPSRTNNVLESFHAALRQRVKVAHPNLFSFLGHLQRTTMDNQADIGRLNNGMAIRRPKKRANIVNDCRIKGCIRRFDNKSYTRLQFLRAVSHSMGAHSDMLCAHAAQSDSGDDADDADADGDDESHHIDSSRDMEATVDTEAVTDDCCEVCLLVPREKRIALVPCGHQRFCESCATEVHNQGRGCPICRTDIQMVLRLF
jgi:hypothetical protein